MFCCGQSRKSTQSHLAQNNHLFEKATTAIIECILKVRITDSNVFNFTTLEDFPDPPFSNFITQSFTTEQRKLIDELSFLCFKRLREDLILQFQKSVSSQEEEAHEGKKMKSTLYFSSDRRSKE